MQRYKVRCHDCDPEIIPHEAGKWVKYSDVERLRAELAECKALLREARSSVDWFDHPGRADTLARIDAARKGEGEVC